MKLTEKELELRDSLMKVISNNQQTELECNQSFKTLWIQNFEKQIEFRYVILGNKIIISRICFAKRHNGCMTECFSVIKTFAKDLGITKIVIQSVETKEMSNWCFKYNFKPNDYCMEIYGFLIGDYEYNVLNT